MIRDLMDDKNRIPNGKNIRSVGSHHHWLLVLSDNHTGVEGR